MKRTNGRQQALSEYERKRNFEKTPEPRGDSKTRASTDAPAFVVQKHDATRLHYDLRLQIGGVLVSWAVPKGPSLDPAHKRLAVHVEDHPLDYAGFEGIIPSGYGAGTVMVWDRGWWEPLEKDPGKAIGKGKLSFVLHGEKLRGAWTLTRIKGRRAGSDDRDNWLLIKRDDEEADTGTSILERLPTSAITDRTLEEIAAAEPAGKKGRSSKRSSRAAKPKEPIATEVSGAKKARMPEGVTPQLCTLTDEAPPGAGWVHEIKYDGYRLIVEKTKTAVRLRTRGDKNWTDRFTPIAEAIADLPVETAVIDGEACVLDSSGHTSFQQLQQAIKARSFKNLVFYAFDLLYLDGSLLTGSPLLQRKRLLKDLLSDASRSILRYSEHVAGEGSRVHEHACELALEGIISKKADAPYTQRRSKTWLKVKCSRRQEFVVIGYTAPGGARKHFGSLLLGAYDGDGRLIYTGKVGTGFNASLLRDIKAQLDGLERKTCPADERPTREEGRDATWVKPELVAEVEFTEWTDDGRLRHPAFQGLRQDKPASAVRIEKPRAAEEVVKQTEKPSKSTERKATGRAKAGEATVAGVRISSPDRMVFPDAGLTKLQLAEYYASVAERMLPYLIGRPLSTVRCPQGRASKCFFQKHLAGTFSDPVRSIRVKEKDGPAEYIAVDSAPGLVALAQFGVIEIHPWGSREGALDTPDMLTFDLDPGDGVAWSAMLDGARRVRDILSDYGLESFPKITGGKGIHVVVPLTPDTEWDEAKAFCKQIATGLAQEDPSRYVATASKAKRGGKIFVDYLRNSQGATSVAPYSARARSGGPVAVPLRWQDLGRLDGPDQYTLDTLPRRLARLKSDPWEGFWDITQSLSAVTTA